MKNLMSFLFTLLFFVNSVFGVEVKISQLTLASGASVVSADSFPYLVNASSVTKRMTIADLINVPAISAAFAPKANPTFTGTATGTFSGPLTGNVTGNLTGNVTGNLVGSVTGNVTGNATGLSATLAIASGGTNSTATPTAGGIGYGTGAAHAYTGAGVTGQLLESAAAGTPTWGSVWYIDATVDGDNPDLGVGNVSTYTEIINANLTLKPQSGSAAVGTMCSSTNAATAPSTGNTTCSVGSESIGINFALPSNHSASAGIYEVCWYSTHYILVDSGEGVQAAFQLIETPTNAQTLTYEGGTRTNSGYIALTIATGSASTIHNTISTCSIFNWSAKAASTVVGVRLMYEQLVTNTPNSSLILADAGTANGQKNMRWIVKRVR